MINVRNINDNPPQFVSHVFHFTIPENLPNINIGKLNTTDKDGPDVVSALLYHLEPSTVPFRITGEILQNTMPLDAELISQYIFTVIAEDGEGMRSLPVRVTVYIEDENEYAPVFSSTVYYMRIAENEPPVTVVGTVSALDEDVSMNTTPVQYSLMGNQNLFTLNATSGDIYLTQSLDYETEHEYNLLIHATDGGNIPSTARVVVQVQDVNEFPPVIIDQVYTAVLEEETEFGVQVLQLNVSDADGSIEYGATVNYTILLPSLHANISFFPFVISPNGWLVTANRYIDFYYDGPSLQFEAQAIDNGGLVSNTITVTIDVVNRNNHPPEFPENHLCIMFLKMHLCTQLLDG